MEKKTIKTSVIIALLTMLGFVSSCKPDSSSSAPMYGLPPTKFEKKEMVEKQNVMPDSKTVSDTIKVDNSVVEQK